MNRIKEKLSAIGNAIREKTGKNELLSLDEMPSEIAAIETGIELNFDIVGGTTEPENPTENMIWINTDVDITGWAFSASDPSVVSVGCREGVSGHYLNASGTEVSNANWRITDYTKLPENSKKIGTVFSASSTSGRYHAFYDGNKNFISSAARKNGTNSFSVPANAVYIRMTVHNNDNMSFNATVTLDEGFVKFPVGTSSPVAFSATQKKPIMVYPLSAKQYVSGKWVDKTAKSWQGGEWVDWWNGELYDTGNLYEYITGGWTTVAWDSGLGSVHVAAKPNVTYNKDNVYLSSGNSSGIFCTANPIDVSSFSTLRFEGSCNTSNGGYRVGLWENLSGSGYFEQQMTASMTPTKNTDGTYELEIGNLSGEYYIGVGLYYSTTTITIRKMQLL